MLKKLKINNFALIEELELDLENGLSVITGESGSGKSLILDAVSSILGSRCSTMNIRNGTEKYTIEALFDITHNEAAREWLAAKGYEKMEQELLLRKELLKDGKSRIMINGGLGSASLLKEIGSILSEVHHQNEQLYLLEKKSQLEIMDEFAGLENVLVELKQSFHSYKKVKQRLEEVTMDDALLKQKQEILKFQIDEIDLAKLKKGEEEDLVHEEQLLSRGEKLSENYTTIVQLLEKSENSILDSLNKVLHASAKIEAVNHDFAEIHNELNEMYYKLRSYSSMLAEEGEDLYFSQERLDSVQKRLDTISKLKKKYGADIPSILTFRDKTSAELDAISLGDSLRNSLKKDLLNATSNLSRLALKISEMRKQSIPLLEESLAAEFAELGMDQAKLQVVMRWEQSSDGEISENGKKYLVSDTGLDQIDFYFCANPGEKPRPLRKVASGGEISRVMLAIKNLMRKNSSSKLIVFDEIDTGISGEVAYNVASRLKNISIQNQILLVTHMQPITAAADNHIKVEKIIEKGRSYSSARILKQSERTVELAKMISGEKITKGALEHAQELLNKKAV